VQPHPSSVREDSASEAAIGAALPNRRIGILYHGSKAEAAALAGHLAEQVRATGRGAWLLPITRDAEAHAPMEETDLLFTLGGDGTIHRASKLAAVHKVPIVGVHLGQLGFLTEVTVDELDEKLPLFLEGRYWIEERSMLRVLHLRPQGSSEYLALNDVVISRGRVARVIEVFVSLNGAEALAYTADGLIVASPTGSTAYSYAAGGPVLHPEARNIILTPLAPFRCFERSLVLDADTELLLRAVSNHETILSVDGQLDCLLAPEDRVLVTESPHRCRFARVRPRHYFMRVLMSRFAPALV
jgi:NAD+ kinase